MSAGPLAGVRVVELAGIGPAPYACMLLADAGAQVVRIDRPSPVSTGSAEGSFADLLARSRPTIAVDLKHPDGSALVLDLAARADAVVEGFRPGVAERLGVGPVQCLERNPRLVYGRMTGWGQDGPLATAAGHDIDYIALTGALWAIGRAGSAPVPPLNLLGDFGGGGMLLAFGICAAVIEARSSGQGQVVDAAMVDGAASLTTFLHGLRHGGGWQDERGVNLLDSGAPFYEVYETADGRYLAVGAIEPPFFAALIEGLGFTPDEIGPQLDRNRWPETKARFAERIASRTRDEWMAVFTGTDACVAPVLSWAEAPGHPHNRERSAFVEVDGVVQPAPAPRFSRTPGSVSGPPGLRDPVEVLRSWGLDQERVASLRASGALPEGG